MQCRPVYNEYSNDIMKSSQKAEFTTLLTQSWQMYIYLSGGGVEEES